MDNINEDAFFYIESRDTKPGRSQEADKRIKARNAERIAKVIRIADYKIATGKSDRQIAKDFALSNVTVSDYMKKRLPKIDYDKYLLCKEIDDAIKDQHSSIDSPKVRARIEFVTKMFLELDMTALEIAKILNGSEALKYIGFDEITENTVYRDLTYRLSEIDSELARQVSEKLIEHSHNSITYSKGKAR